MSKDDLNNLGSLYGGMLNGLKKDLIIKEGKIGPGEIGAAELETGGPQEEGGYADAEVDVEKLSDKEKEDNLYNINKLSYTSNYMPEEDEERSDGTDDGECEECGGLGCEDCNGTGEKSEEDDDKEEDAEEKIDLMNAFDKGTDPEDKDTDEDELIDKKLFDEEDEESSQISEKIARDGLNNFMKQKSQFDSLYNKVMVSENFDEMESEDFDALGIDTEAQDEVEGGDEITVTLSKDVAQALCDVLQAAMGESDSEDGDEAEAATEGAFGEEDEEGIDTGSTHSGKYDDGKNNKVGDLKTAAAATAKGADSKLDSGSNLNTSYNDGKSNKVGSLSTGTRAVD